MAMAKPARLPSEYQEVEYIGTTEQTLTQSYILTGVSGNNKLIELKHERTTVFTGPQIIINSYNPSDPSSVIAPWAATNGIVGGGATITPASSIIDTPKIYTVRFPATSYNIRIGGWTDRTWTAGSRYYYVKVFDSNTLIFDGVPCYRKSDGKTGLYDLIGQAFVPNSGTEEFILGQNV